MMEQAARIAVNRTVAGVHFPVDTMVGARLGLMLGDYVVAQASSVEPAPLDTVHTTELDATGVQSGDFSRRQVYDAGALTLGRHADASNGWAAAAAPTVSITDGPNSLNWLWKKALAEWEQYAP